MLTLNSIVHRNEKIPCRLIENEGIIVDVEHNNIVQLNEVAAFIWKNIEKKKTVDKIVDCIYDSFEIEKKMAEKDTLDFLNKLLEKGFILVK